jgi:hypothetical protein
MRRGKLVTHDLGKIADWLTAFGTIGAVVTALYLAKIETRPKAKILLKIGYMVDSINGVSKEPVQVSAQIVNISLTPIHLSE